ncbi:hypothetical protein [Parvicella tangerina]|nr:hypothetical protein [Parvicella tangerina]
MIEIRKGELTQTGMKGIFENNENDEVKDIWSLTLRGDCYIVVVETPEEYTVLQPMNIGLEMIPRKNDLYADFYGLFWCSERVLIFNSFQELEGFKLVVDGPDADGIYELIDQTIELMELGIAEQLLADITDIEEMQNDKMYREISKVCKRLNISRNVAFATMKAFMLSHYLNDLNELRNSRLN